MAKASVTSTTTGCQMTVLVAFRSAFRTQVLFTSLLLAACLLASASAPAPVSAQEVMTRYPIVSNQVLYNLNRREIERDLLPYCQEHQITILAYTPLDDGRLATRSRFQRSQGERVLEQVATETQKTLAQVALNWCTAHPYVIAIPKSNSFRDP